MVQHSAEPNGAAQQTTGELVSQLTNEISQLVRGEMRLAQLELGAKAKKAGLGAGLFGGAGVIALFGVGSLVAAAICALALVVSAWLAALIVGVVLLAVAGAAALVGKSEISQATPPLPEQALEGVKQDVRTLKPGDRS